MNPLTELYEKEVELIEVRVFCLGNLGKIISFEKEMAGRLNNLSVVSYQEENEGDVIFAQIELVGEAYTRCPESYKAILSAELRELGYINVKVR